MKHHVFQNFLASAEGFWGVFLSVAFLYFCVIPLAMCFSSAVCVCSFLPHIIFVIVAILCVGPTLGCEHAQFCQRVYIIWLDLHSDIPPLLWPVALSFINWTRDLFSSFLWLSGLSPLTLGQSDSYFSSKEALLAWLAPYPWADRELESFLICGLRFLPFPMLFFSLKLCVKPGQPIIFLYKWRGTRAQSLEGISSLKLVSFAGS